PHVSSGVRSAGCNLIATRVVGMSETIAITGKSVKLFKGHYTSEVQFFLEPRILKLDDSSDFAWKIFFQRLSITLFGKLLPCFDFGQYDPGIFPTNSRLTIDPGPMRRTSGTADFYRITPPIYGLDLEGLCPVATSLRGCDENRF
ncbi:MAG: hypothetical protein ACREYE_11450, partial [Gammaproteobacteria bacterium]